VLLNLGFQDSNIKLQMVLRLAAKQQKPSFWMGFCCLDYVIILMNC